MEHRRQETKSEVCWSEAYMIENGILKDAVKDPVFEITTPKYWGSIDARAKVSRSIVERAAREIQCRVLPYSSGGRTFD